MFAGVMNHISLAMQLLSLYLSDCTVASIKFGGGGGLYCGVVFQLGSAVNTSAY